MKKLTLAILAATSLAVIGAPAAARAGHAVKFTYKEQELKTEKSRAALLARMEATTTSACSGAKAKAYLSAMKCREDLESQYLAAIDHPQLASEYEYKIVQIAGNIR
ncbi:UrcA family protein [Pontixanthobacter aquaemixtae]|uniref:UrcA family protein n=1 Tax=Pontixanthobacter aquaemixtae TaxID=1958940 RepID=A0A844ZXQ7_9SPHN|nr:UrcA family protein [Pontixanthobacter aquaemixtae]MXO91726.1 UrcA family protein [Pontixanthobacter aquaemixtae]